MRRLLSVITACTLLLSGTNGAPAGDRKLNRRQEDALLVDLDYARYRGYIDNSTGLDVWKGIRYAAPPVSINRWKAPQDPSMISRSRADIINATTFGNICPQAYPSVPNAPFVPGNEDCLFLNVYAPPTLNSTQLPVFVWIHGGGYGLGDGRQDLSELITATGNGFVGVTIQYRLGAFGFLSSGEVKANGVVNAALLDMEFALKWVRKHISKFGGNPDLVTIAGESAGGGAVMLLGIARDGNLGSSLFGKVFAASPYLPAQYDYNSTRATQLYQDFAKRVGCPTSNSTLDCLRQANTEDLQYANSNISASQTYGTWPFVPVTDYSFLTQLPSIALSGSQPINGKAILVGNNANEGPLFTPPTITTLDDLKAWLRLEFPTFSDIEIQTVLDAYPSTDTPVNPDAPKFATDGYEGATAVNVSQVATGQQQRANNIYAEATFICPSYWLNSAYTHPNASSSPSYHYQYSVPFASHGEDVTAYFGPATPNQPPSFTTPFRRMIGNFILTGNPSLSHDEGDAIGSWPSWTAGEGAKMVNLNVTGGTPYEVPSNYGVNITQFKEPGLKNNFEVVDAWKWEGGRGQRCEFWKGVAGKVSI